MEQPGTVPQRSNCRTGQPSRHHVTQGNLETHMGPTQTQNLLAQQNLYDFTTDLSCKDHRIVSAKKETPAPWLKKKGGLETPQLT